MSGPRAEAIQAAWDALAAGDPTAAFEMMAEDVVVDNGPGAGPWRHVEGRDALLAVLVQLAARFNGDWKQVGQVVYADDELYITVVKETGTAPSGDVFDNRAVYVARTGPGGTINRLWTVDLAHEALEKFWARNPVRG